MDRFKYVLITFSIFLIFGFWWGATNKFSNRHIVSPPIMEVHETFGKVYIRENLRSGWDEVILEDSLRPGTEVRTLENGATHLLFLNNDGRAELGANTHISFSDKDGTNIRFHSGEMYVSFHSTKEKENLKVNFRNIAIELHDSDIFIYQDEDGRFNVSVPYGSIKLVKAENKLEFDSGQVIQFAGDNEYTVFEPQIRMLTPLNSDRFSILNEDRIPVRFAWKNQSDYTSYQIFLGASIQTLKSVLTINNPTKKEAVLTVSPGFHYFRVYAFDKNNRKKFVYSDLHKFLVHPQATIQPLLPRDNAELDLHKGGTEIKFQWDNPSQFEKLFLEVSKTPNFRDLAFHETIQGANFLFVNFEKSGEFYWRINGFPHRTSKLILGPTRKLTVR